MGVWPNAVCKVYIVGLSCSAKTLCINALKTVVRDAGARQASRKGNHGHLVEVPSKVIKSEPENISSRKPTSPPSKKKETNFQNANCANMQIFELLCWKMIVYPVLYVLSFSFCICQESRTTIKQPRRVKIHASCGVDCFPFRRLQFDPRVPWDPVTGLVVVSGLLVCGFFLKNPKVFQPFFGKVTFRNSKSAQVPQLSHAGFTEPPCVFYLWLWKTPFKKTWFWGTPGWTSASGGGKLLGKTGALPAMSSKESGHFSSGIFLHLV